MNRYLKISFLFIIFNSIVSSTIFCQYKSRIFSEQDSKLSNEQLKINVKKYELVYINVKEYLKKQLSAATFDKEEFINYAMSFRYIYTILEILRINLNKIQAEHYDQPSLSDYYNDNLRIYNSYIYEIFKILLSAEKRFDFLQEKDFFAKELSELIAETGKIFEERSGQVELNWFYFFEFIRDDKDFQNDNITFTTCYLVFYEKFKNERIKLFLKNSFLSFINPFTITKA